MVYDDVCIRNSPIPIALDTGYTAAGTLKGNSLPVYRDIALHNVRISGGGKISFNGHDHEHRVAAKLDGVVATDPGSYTYSLQHADLAVGPREVNLRFPVGVDSTVQGSGGHGAVAESCEEKFVPFPAE